jgi:hypothetical protein
MPEASPAQVDRPVKSARETAVMAVRLFSGLPRQLVSAEVVAVPVSLVSQVVIEFRL